MRRTHQLIAYVCVSCLVSLLAGPARAQPAENFNELLEGTYRFNSHVTCAQVDSGSFDSSGVPILALGVGNNIHRSLTGVTTYDGAGTAHTTASGIALFPEPYASGTPAVGPFNEECKWMYTVNRDGFFRVGGFCTDTTNSPPAYKIAGIKYTGQIGASGAVLSTAQVEPNVVTLEQPIGTPVAKRICAGTGTELRIRQQ